MFCKGFTSRFGKGRELRVARGPWNVTFVLRHYLGATVKKAFIGREYLSNSHCLSDICIFII